jgi:hypothetical protein
MPIESNITKRVIKYLNSLENCVAEKVFGNGISSGKADINACYHGRSVRIEMKSPDHGNKASKKQELNLKRWEKAGAICGVCYSLEDVKELLGIDE